MKINKYPLKPNIRQFNGIDKLDDIYLSSKIGNGQIGGTKVLLKGETLAKGNLSQATLIGNTKKLLDEEIEVVTNVLDVNNFTNMCVITTTFLNQENKVLYTKIDNGEAPIDGIASFKGKYKLTLLSLIYFFLVF